MVDTMHKVRLLPGLASHFAAHQDLVFADVLEAMRGVLRFFVENANENGGTPLPLGASPPLSRMRMAFYGSEVGVVKGSSCPWDADVYSEF